MAASPASPALIIIDHLLQHVLFFKLNQSINLSILEINNLFISSRDIASKNPYVLYLIINIYIFTEIL